MLCYDYPGSQVRTDAVRFTWLNIQCRVPLRGTAQHALVAREAQTLIPITRQINAQGWTSDMKCCAIRLSNTQ